MSRNILKATIITVLKRNLRERDYRKGAKPPEIENATFPVKPKTAGM